MIEIGMVYTFDTHGGDSTWNDRSGENALLFVRLRKMKQIFLMLVRCIASGLVMALKRMLLRMNFRKLDKLSLDVLKEL